MKKIIQIWDGTDDDYDNDNKDDDNGNNPGGVMATNNLKMTTQLKIGMSCMSNTHKQCVKLRPQY